MLISSVCVGFYEYVCLHFGALSAWVIMLLCYINSPVSSTIYGVHLCVCVADYGAPFMCVCFSRSVGCVIIEASSSLLRASHLFWCPHTEELLRVPSDSKLQVYRVTGYKYMQSTQFMMDLVCIWRMIERMVKYV